MTIGLDLHDVSKHYNHPLGQVDVLKGITLKVPVGQMHAVMGPSGSGKSTLVRMIACLERPDSGKITVNGLAIPDPWSAAGAAYRNATCGLLLQDFGLIEHLSARKNAALPLRYSRQRNPDGRQRVGSLFQELGVEHRAEHRVSLLSGGERQRVAMARALVMNPLLVIADEPTGALDHARSQEVVELLRSVAAGGRTVLMVTHDAEMAERCDAIWHMEDGQLSA